MLTEKKIIGKLEKAMWRYEKLRFTAISEKDSAQMFETKEHYRSEPKGNGITWKKVKKGDTWGGPWVTGWFRADFTVPKKHDGAPLFITPDTGSRDVLIFVNGVPRGVYDENHTHICLSTNPKPGEKFHVAVESYALHPFPGVNPDESEPDYKVFTRAFSSFTLSVENKDISAFVCDLGVLLSLADALDDNSLRKNSIVRTLRNVYKDLPLFPAEHDEKTWRSALAKARKIMAPELAKKNSESAPEFSVMGHSHLDTAWLWPVKETWRKAARTFSSVATLMEQYPDMIFLQPAPCHAHVIQKEYPALFDRIKKYVKEGRWEPNGAMWVEPDCNIPSGESFIRQLMFGQKTTQDMFNYSGDTLWLPDVFGYSAALPQILKGCGVQYFCTTKISWNDTTRFPYDAFWWYGIDGTKMLSHFNKMDIWPTPKDLISHWKDNVQHKDVQTRHLSAYGRGDGGGGPMAEMCEIVNRIHDLEGCPRVTETTLSQFMQTLEKENTELPAWRGELYLELHRGTLTSCAKIKRGNRLCEIALRDAEIINSIATLKGAEYPHDIMAQVWQNVLTNQFHDILPGSSIKEANDVAENQLEESLQTAHSCTENALTYLGGSPRAKKRMLIANTLSWERDSFTLDNVPEGMYPAADDVRTQWVQSIDGTPELAVANLPVAPLATRVVPLTDTPCKADSPFKVSKTKIETPFASLRFDKAGRITSLVEKQSKRECIRKNALGNEFLCGEDVPEVWDNWDIDSDQELKMLSQNELVSREIIADGPVQLRVRSVYQIGNSSIITQDMVCYAASPRIDFVTKIDWHEKHMLLKVRFACDLTIDNARHEIQYGYVTRPTHRNRPEDQARFEVCAHKWTDMSENGFGIALLNDCKYGVSMNESDIALTLLKSGTHPDPRGDEGTHYMTYSLCPHNSGFSVPAVVRPAYELNTPVASMTAGNAAETTQPIATVDMPNVIIETIKQAEDGKGIVIRIYEAEGTGVHTTLTLGFPVSAVYTSNMLEQEREKCTMKKGSVKLYIPAHKIVTLYCEI